MSSDSKKINNFFVHIVPLAIKRMAGKVVSLHVKRHFTMTFSNIGKIEISNKYRNYIENFFMVLVPDWAEKIRCGICSYEDNLSVTFGTSLKDNLIESRFSELLKENGINLKKQHCKETV